MNPSLLFVEFSILFAEFKNRVLRYTKHWVNIIRHVVESRKPFHLLIFEDLVKDPIKEIKKVLHFLEKNSGFRAERQEERLLCLHENLEGTAKRKPKSFKTDPFTNRLKIHVNKLIDNAQSMLSKAKLSANVTFYKQKVF